MTIGEVGHRLGDVYRGVVGKMMGVETVSQFISKGTLTPGETSKKKT